MGGERQLHEERRTARGWTAEEESLVRDGWSDSDGHPSAFARAPSPLPSVRVPLSVANWRGIRGLCNQEGREREKRRKKKGGSALGRRASEERSNRCQLGEMREERGDDDGDDDDERRAAAVGKVLIG